MLFTFVVEWRVPVTVRLAAREVRTLMTKRAGAEWSRPEPSFTDWLGAVGLGFIGRQRNWDGHLLQAAIGCRAQEMP